MKPIDAICPSCESRGLQEFYRVDDVPVNSCLTVASAGAGRTFPRGNLRIAVCEACGFITNTAFDERQPTYDTTYEETQTFSPTFVAFQDALIHRLLERYDLRGKRVVEIGCGKGDFLARMAELGDVHGIGIDSTSIPARLTGVAAKNVRFIHEFYGRHHASLAADLLVCRHALEHIPAVGTLLQTVYESLGERQTPVFFELPETRRVLRESAYWDFYYEHCSYFTPGSLARAFERRAFRVTGVRVEYADQYLMLEARTGRGPREDVRVYVDTPADVVADARTFERSIAAKLDAWRRYFDDAWRRGKTIAIWGSGSKCVAFLSTIGVDREVAAVTDVNPYRHHKFIPGTGKEIVPPERLAGERPDEVIVMNPIYCDEVSARLRELGVATHVISAESPQEALV